MNLSWLVLTLALFMQQIMMGGGRVVFTPAPSGYTIINTMTSGTEVYTHTYTPATTGNLLTVLVLGYNCSGLPVAVVDTAANVWYQDLAYQDTGGTNSAFSAFHAVANGNSATTITVSGHTSCFYGSFGVIEASGVSTYDNGNTGTSGVFNPISVTVVTAHSNELCIGMGSQGFDNTNPTTGFSTSIALFAEGGHSGNVIVGPSTGTSTVIGTKSASNPLAMIGVCYK